MPVTQETWVQSLGWEDLLEEGMATTPVFLPEESQGQRRLVGHSPRDSLGKNTGMGYHFLLPMKAERQRIDPFELWCWRRLLRVPWTARRSNQSILKEISPD